MGSHVNANFLATSGEESLPSQEPEQVTRPRDRHYLWVPLLRVSSHPLLLSSAFVFSLRDSVLVRMGWP